MRVSREEKGRRKEKEQRKRELGQETEGEKEARFLPNLILKVKNS